MPADTQKLAAALEAPASGAASVSELGPIARAALDLEKENAALKDRLGNAEQLLRDSQSAIDAARAAMEQANHSWQIERERQAAEIRRLQGERDTYKGQFTELKAGLVMCKNAFSQLLDQAEISRYSGEHTNGRRMTDRPRVVPDIA